MAALADNHEIYYLLVRYGADEQVANQLKKLPLEEIPIGGKFDKYLKGT